MVQWLQETPDLFAWIDRTLADGERSGLDWKPQGPSKQEFFAGLRQTAEQYDSISLAPHEPPIAGTYYTHPSPDGGGGEAIRGLLGFFRPSTP